MVSANIWAMTHDEKFYPDPFTFQPERFFNGDGTLNDDSRVLAYGFGRRYIFWIKVKPFSAPGQS